MWINRCNITATNNIGSIVRVAGVHVYVRITPSTPVMVPSNVYAPSHINNDADSFAQRQQAFHAIKLPHQSGEIGTFDTRLI